VTQHAGRHSLQTFVHYIPLFLSPWATRFALRNISCVPTVVHSYSRTLSSIHLSQMGIVEFLSCLLPADVVKAISGTCVYMKPAPRPAANLPLPVCFRFSDLFQHPSFFSTFPPFSQLAQRSSLDKNAPRGPRSRSRFATVLCPCLTDSWHEPDINPWPWTSAPRPSISSTSQRYTLYAYEWLGFLLFRFVL